LGAGLVISPLGKSNLIFIRDDNDTTYDLMSVKTTIRCGDDAKELI